MQHSRNRAIVYGFVGVHRFRVVLLHDVVHAGKGLQAIADVGVPAGQRRRSALLSEHHAQKAANDQNKNDQEERTRTTDHR